MHVTAPPDRRAATTRRPPAWLLDETEREFAPGLGDANFGARRDRRRSPDAGVVSLARTGRRQLALAESCTGGEISARLTDVPGVRRFLVESA